MLGSVRTFQRRLLAWYSVSHRTLPWRISPGSAETPDPYRVLVSEIMLQQTTVSTVVSYFTRFIARFPTVADLAGAEEQEVLRLWQGLGYYSRARNLQAAARLVLAKHGGSVPSTVEELMRLPGIGRYTAGAVSSIAFNKPAPIVDGNVARVLCRLDSIRDDLRVSAVQRHLWESAENILPARRAGDFNTALMELGALVCVPRSPQCLVCPVRQHCGAVAAGIQEKIPAPKKAAPTPLCVRHTYCIRRGDAWLIEQRPPRGRWAGLWQFITVEAANVPDALPVPVGPAEPLGAVTHSLTHRRYEFRVFRCESLRSTGAPDADRPRAWVALKELSRYPVSRPHLRIAEMLRDA